jgi:hypothetical protein
MTYDATKPCKTDGMTHVHKSLEGGKQNLAMLNGYWVWWCITHDQPKFKCEIAQLKEELKLRVRPTKKITTGNEEL